MSVTQCRTCDQPITFVLREDGRWRPVEVTYEELAPEGDEMLSVQKGGSWQALPGVVRVYRSHRCLEDPSWNQGRPKTTAYVRDSDENDEDDQQVCTHCGCVDDHDDDECPNLLTPEARSKNPSYLKARERALRKMSTEMQYVLTIQCPECAAAVGEPCQSENWPVLTVCTPRKLSVAFGEGQQWPPRYSQIGSKQMREWLADHVTVLTGEA